MKTTTIGMIGLVAGLALAGCDTGGWEDEGQREVEEPSNTTHLVQNPTPYDAPPISEAQKAEFLHVINSARSVAQDSGEYGVMPAVPALVWSNELYIAAYEHNDDLIASSTYSHYGSGTASDWTSVVNEMAGRGSWPGDRAVNNGYTGLSTGENIVAGPPTASVAINSWLGSDGHCSNLMKAKWKIVGMARVENTWTQMFGL